MKLQELCAEYESAFLKMIEDYIESDPESLKLLFPRKAPSTSAEFQKFAKDSAKERIDAVSFG